MLSLRASLLGAVLILFVTANTCGSALMLLTAAGSNNNWVCANREWSEERKLMFTLRHVDTEDAVDACTFLVHTVVHGETLWSLGVKYEVKVQTLTQVNDLSNPNVIRAGHTLLIPPGDGVMYTMGRHDTLMTVAKKFNIPADELLSLNRQLATSAVGVIGGNKLFVPGVTYKSLISSGGDGQVSPVRFVWPVRGRITSGYGPRWGRFHSGIDIAAPTGTPVRSTKSGTIVSVGWISGYGRTIRVDHGDTVVSLYAHLSTAFVRAGQRVARGEVIGLVGSTGASTGPHLHFEIIKNFKPINPEPLLTGHEQ